MIAACNSQFGISRYPMTGGDRDSVSHSLAISADSDVGMAVREVVEKMNSLIIEELRKNGKQYGNVKKRVPHMCIYMCH